MGGFSKSITGRVILRVDEVEKGLRDHDEGGGVTGCMGAACDVREWRELAAWLRARP